MHRRFAFVLVFCLLLCVFGILAIHEIEERASEGYRVRNLATNLAYSTIQAAIEAPETLDGHTIFVENGTYPEHLNVTKAVLLTGENRETTVLDGGGIGTVVAVQSNASISGLKIQNGSIGVGVFSCKGGRVDDSIIQYNERGVYIFNSTNVVVSSNFITNNYETSLVLNRSDIDVISKNTISSNHLYPLEAFDLYDSSYNSIIENTLVGNQVTAIQLSDSSSHNSICNNLLENNLGGIQLVGQCNYNAVEQNTVAVNETAFGLPGAIWIRESEHNTVNANRIMSNRTSPSFAPPYSDGIGLSRSTDNSVISNTISLMDVGIGFHFSADNNNVSGNVITRNGHGVDFSEGISNNNSFYFNNFIENVKQAFNRLSVNVWDSGYPSGGNYWTDFNATDSYCGPFQNQTGSDGISDTPYLIDANNRDNYPLMGIFCDFNVTRPEETYHVDIVTNSTISNSAFEIVSTPNGSDLTRTIKFDVTGIDGTTVFCRVSIPKALMNGTYLVLVNGTEVPYTLLQFSNETRPYLHFTLSDSTREVSVTSESPTGIPTTVYHRNGTCTNCFKRKACLAVKHALVLRSFSTRVLSRAPNVIFGNTRYWFDFLKGYLRPQKHLHMKR